jgi:hypothetical protein
MTWQKKIRFLIMALSKNWRSRDIALVRDV